jgi:hypothetical protein
LYSVKKKGAGQILHLSGPRFTVGVLSQTVVESSLTHFPTLFDQPTVQQAFACWPHTGNLGSIRCNGYLGKQAGRERERERGRLTGVQMAQNTALVLKVCK